MWATIRTSIKEGWFFQGFFFFVVGILVLIIATLIQDKYSIGASVLTAIGTVFSLSVAVHFFDQAFQRRKRREELREDIQYGLESLEHQGKVGLHQVLPEMKFDALFDELKKNDTLYWLDTYNANFKLWANSLQRALERGAKFRILIIDPNADTLKYRLAEIQDVGVDLIAAKEAIRSLRNVLTDLKIRFPDALEFKLYDTLPTMPAYVIERSGKPVRAYSSLFLSRQTQMGFPHFVWSKPLDKNSEYDFLQHIHAHVRRKWEMTAAAQVGDTQSGPA